MRQREMFGERRGKPRKGFWAVFYRLLCCICSKGGAHWLGHRFKFFGGLEDTHRGVDELVSAHHLLGVRNRGLSHENVAQWSTRGCGGSFNFFKESKSPVEVCCAEVLKVLHLCIAK